MCPARNREWLAAIGRGTQMTSGRTRHIRCRAQWQERGLNSAPPPTAPLETHIHVTPYGILLLHIHTHVQCVCVCVCVCVVHSLYREGVVYSETKAFISPTLQTTHSECVTGIHARTLCVETTCLYLSTTDLLKLPQESIWNCGWGYGDLRYRSSSLTDIWDGWSTNRPVRQTHRKLT